MKILKYATLLVAIIATYISMMFVVVGKPMAYLFSIGIGFIAIVIWMLYITVASYGIG